MDFFSVVLLLFFFVVVVVAAAAVVTAAVVVAAAVAVAAFALLLLLLLSSFTDNKADTRSALLSLRYPMYLDGENIFKRNIGGAITLLQTQLDFSGLAWFESNSARDSGAIKMLDQSIVCLLINILCKFLLIIVVICSPYVVELEGCQSDVSW